MKWQVFNIVDDQFQSSLSHISVNMLELFCGVRIGATKEVGMFVLFPGLAWKRVLPSDGCDAKSLMHDGIHTFLPH